MEKILISFIAYRDDFMMGNPIVFNNLGPHAKLWLNCLSEYSKHILLWTMDENPDNNEQSDTYRLSAVTKFQADKKYKKVECQYLPELKKDLINVEKIRQVLEDKIQEIYASQKDIELEAYISPGTPAMQVAWYLNHLSKENRLKIFQTRPDKFRRNESEDIREYVEITQLNASIALKRAEQKHYRKDDASNIKINNSIKSAYDKALNVAKAAQVPALIIGPTGSGKEGLAKYIHDHSTFDNLEFWKPINCGAFSDSTLKSELFGYAKGAFTDAKENKIGFFEAAGKGTLFLDEIGEMSPEMQSSLLRVLQTREFTPIGSTKAKKFEGRIVAATHKNLKQMCIEGRFRWDLYYRISAATINLPAFCDWHEKDKAQLLEELLDVVAEEIGRSKRLIFDLKAKRKLLSYSFPGNIRELRNIITSLYLFHNDSEISLEIMYQFTGEESNPEWNLEQVTALHIQKTYLHFKKNKTIACEKLGIAKNTLDKYLNLLSEE